MAGAGWRQWTRETLSVSMLQQYLQDQVVQWYASASARTAQLSAPTDGMVTYLSDTKRLSLYDGAAFQVLPRAGDTGWQTIVLMNGYSGVPEGARYRVMHGVCYFQIGANRNSAANNVQIVQFPVGARPAHVHWFVGNWASVPSEFRIGADGIARVQWGGTVPGGIVVAGSFPID